jgi:hypothetical protein
MILLEIDSDSVTFIKRERDTPRSIDMNGVAHRFSPQGMEVKSGNVHILGASRSIKRVEPAQAAFVQGILKTSRRARFEQFLQALMPEAPDHCSV